MSYRNLEHTFFMDPKVRRLAKKLDIHILTAHGAVSGLWSWSLSYARDGDITKYFDEDIEDVLQWPGEPGALMRAMVECRLIDEFVDGGQKRYIVHNWVVRGGTFAESQRKQELRKKKKKLSQNVPECPGTSRDVPECPALEEKRREENIRIHTCDDATPKPKNVKPPESGLAAGDLFSSQAETPGQEPSNDVPAEPESEQRGCDEQVDRQELESAPGAQVVNLPVERNNGVADDVDEVWQHYRTYHPRCPRRLASNRKEYKLIKARLEDFCADDLKQAIDGYHRSPFHTGKNETGTTYLSLELMMRDIGKVMSGLEYARQDTGAGLEKNALTARSAGGLAPPRKGEMK